MLIHATTPLFAWDELEISPTLATIKDALRAIPDAELLAALHQRRHNGCDTDPVSVLWGVLLLSIILRPTTREACREELRRNAPLRLLIGIASEDACPAVVEGFRCASAKTGNAGQSYGVTVRVPHEIDLRRFPSIPRATPQFARLDKGRTSVERVNDRLKVFWGIDDGNVVGSHRFCAHVGAVLIVQVAFATLLAKAQRQDGSFGTMTLAPIAKKLRALLGKTVADSA